MDLSQTPAAMPPPGVTPDFNSPDNYKHDNIILHSIVLSFTTLAVLVRVYTRAVVKKSFGLDDCESHPTIPLHHLHAVEVPMLKRCRVCALIMGRLARYPGKLVPR